MSNHSLTDEPGTETERSRPAGVLSRQEKKPEPSTPSRIDELTRANEVLQGEILRLRQEITEQKRREELLRNSESLYHSLVESLPLNVFRKDRLGRFTFGNSRFCSTLGQSAQQIVGKTDY